MFREIVSNLSLSPAAETHLAYYWRRLCREQPTRRLALFMGGLLVVVQLATIIAPPDVVNTSHNGTVYGDTTGQTDLPGPLPRRVETTSAALPHTGLGTSTLIVLIFVGGITYLYFRNRQLMAETKMLRGDHHGGRLGE